MAAERWHFIFLTFLLELSLPVCETLLAPYFAAIENNVFEAPITKFCPFRS